MFDAPQEEQAVLWKLDAVLLTLLSLGYFIKSLGKLETSIAASQCRLRLTCPQPLLQTSPTSRRLSFRGRFMNTLFCSTLDSDALCLVIIAHVSQGREHLLAP